MTLPSWPAGLPFHCDRTGFSLEQAHPAAAVTHFEDGPDRMRRRSFTRIKKIGYRIPRFTEADCLTATNFIEQTLDDGTLRFRMMVRLPGTDYSERTVYLDQGAYKLVPSGFYWALTCTLCVMPGS